MYKLPTRATLKKTLKVMSNYSKSLILVPEIVYHK